MKLRGTNPFPGFVSDDQPAADFIGSTPLSAPPTLPALRIVEGCVELRFAKGPKIYAGDHSQIQVQQVPVETRLRRAYSNYATVTTGAGSMPGSALNSPGNCFRASGRPMTSSGLTLPLRATSGWVGTPPMASPASHLSRLAKESKQIRHLHLPDASTGWHDSISIETWQRTFEQHDTIEPAGRAPLLLALSQAISVMDPVQRASEAFWLVLEKAAVLPASEQAGVLQGLSGQMHCATSGADGQRMVDRLIQCAKQLPDQEQAKVYLALLGQCQTMGPATLNHAFFAVLHVTETLLPASADRCIEALTASLNKLEPSAHCDAFCLLTDVVGRRIVDRARSVSPG